MDYVRTTRQTLIQRLKDPDDNLAWTDFYEFYYEIIVGWATRMGCARTQVDDIFQETMITLLRKMDRFEYDPKRGSFKALLKSIVRSRVIDHFRREGRYVDVTDNEGNDLTGNIEDESAAGKVHDDSGEDSLWLQSVLNQALRQTYKKIDQVTYKSFCLYVIEGLPVEEVSRRLDGLRRGTIYQQKSRLLKMAEKEFCELLEKLGEPIEQASAGTDFIKAVEEMVHHRPEYRETIIQAAPVKPDFSKLELVRKVLENVGRNLSGAAVIVIDVENIDNSQRVELVSSLSIGKQDKCDIVLNDDMVSGLHATVSRDGDCYFIKDENSANGTLVNSTLIKGDHELHDSDIITFSERYFALFIVK